MVIQADGKSRSMESLSVNRDVRLHHVRSTYFERSVQARYWCPNHTPSSVFHSTPRCLMCERSGVEEEAMTRRVRRNMFVAVGLSAFILLLHMSPRHSYLESLPSIKDFKDSFKQLDRCHGDAELPDDEKHATRGDEIVLRSGQHDMHSQIVGFPDSL